MKRAYACFRSFLAARPPSGSARSLLWRAPYPPERLIQPEDVAQAVLAMLRLPRTVEATQLILRPMQKV